MRLFNAAILPLIISACAFGQTYTIYTVAGNGTAGYGGDNGPASTAGLNYPYAVAVDSAGNLYIADFDNNRIRKVSNGVITTVAGNGTCCYSGDNGPAASAELQLPIGVAVDSAGSVYIADSWNNRVRRLTTPVAAPAIYVGGIVNAASYATGTPLAPGSVAAAYGTFLLAAPSSAAGLPLPTSLGGLSMRFGSGMQVPLLFVGAGQVNFQVPWELAGQSQSSLTAALNGQAGIGQTATLAPFSPGIFSTNAQGTGQGAILDPSYVLVNPSNPASAGSTVVQIYCTGLGAVTNQPATGSPAPASPSPLSMTTTTPTVTVGGAQATVIFSGLAPGFVGLYQVNALVPAGSSKGASVPVVIAIGGATSNTVTIAVQ